jgi:hypothetical protein
MSISKTLKAVGGTPIDCQGSGGGIRPSTQTPGNTVAAKILIKILMKPSQTANTRNHRFVHFSERLSRRLATRTQNYVLGNCIETKLERPHRGQTISAVGAEPNQHDRRRSENYGSMS